MKHICQMMAKPFEAAALRGRLQMMIKFIKLIFFISVLSGEFYQTHEFSIFANNSGTWTFSQKVPSFFRNRIILVPVAGFKSQIDNITASDPKEIFKQKIVISNATREVLDKSTVRENGYKVVPDIFSFVENHQDYVALVRLSELNSRVRVISVNGVYFYENNKGYLLTLYSDQNSVPQGDELMEIFTFAQTGVTALTRGLINKINAVNNPLYVSEKIAPFLRQFDLTHTSNEVSFSENCEFIAKTMKFCSPLSYFSVLKSSGFDIIELTGNHNNDYDFPAALSTMKLYEENKMRYFGGGINLKESQKILFIESSKKIKNVEANVSGEKIALIGYNQANVYYQYDLPLAKDNSPGANPFEMEKMRGDIREAKKGANTVIVDFQFAECDAYKLSGNDDCYQPMIKPDQRIIFQSAIDYGADIVVGTQAHQPQIIEKYKNGIIFYGLGNLFFDQIRWEGTRQGMVLVHIFFKGQYKNTIVYPTYYDERMQTYLPSGEKKKELLDIYYQRR